MSGKYTNIHSVIVWRGLIIDVEMPRSVEDYITEIKKIGCPLGANGGKIGLMRGFQLLTPTIPQHTLDPFEITRKIQEAGPDSERYNAESKDWSAVCVCGDRGGAMHYATRSRGVGLVIKAYVPIERLTVDGRDFLYTAVPELCKADPQSFVSFLPSLKAAFSDIIETYIEAGRPLVTDMQLLFRLVDYMVMDRRVINAQLASKVDLFGRYGTAFRSAFGVRGGIMPSEIVDVMKVNKTDVTEDARPVAETKLSDLLKVIRCPR